jgi:hypothetical protein
VLTRRKRYPEAFVGFLYLLSFIANEKNKKKLLSFVENGK